MFYAEACKSATKGLQLAYVSLLPWGSRLSPKGSSSPRSTCQVLLASQELQKIFEPPLPGLACITSCFSYCFGCNSCFKNKSASSWVGFQLLVVTARLNSLVKPSQSVRFDFGFVCSMRHCMKSECSAGVCTGLQKSESVEGLLCDLRCCRNLGCLMGSGTALMMSLSSPTCCSGGKLS